MTKRRYYFQVPSRNITSFVEAYSFVDAKAIAFDKYAFCWREMEWLTREAPQEEPQECTRVFF